VIPAKLVALPETFTEPAMVAPACGVEIEIAGGELLNVTDIEVVVEWPTESMAIAEKEWPPSA
jgi:hypothetical protein